MKSAQTNYIPFAPFLNAWTHRKLILRLAKREIDTRYRGTILGMVWPVLVPLLFLLIYTFVFSVVFNARWDSTITNRGHFAIVLFSGLIFYNLFAECIARAPTLMLSNVTYIKKVVFPLEILPWVCLISALFNTLISGFILLIGYSIVVGIPPWTTLIIPLLLAPLVLIIVGISMFLCSVGVFVRDLQQIVGIFLTLIMFLSPIFYPLSALPTHFHTVIQLSPLTFVVESARGLLFDGVLPNFTWWVLYLGAGWLVIYAGYAWFMATRKGFADVV